MERAPHALGQTLCALDMLVSPPQEIAIIGPREEAATRELAAAALGGFHPNAVVAYGDGAGEDDLPLLAGKTLVNGRPAVYVCERFACRAPLTDPAAVAGALV